MNAKKFVIGPDIEWADVIVIKMIKMQTKVNLNYDSKKTYSNQLKNYLNELSYIYIYLWKSYVYINFALVTYMPHSFSFEVNYLH